MTQKKKFRYVKKEGNIHPMYPCFGSQGTSSLMREEKKWQKKKKGLSSTAKPD